MKYVNGLEILPLELVYELQKYAEGKVIYIPKAQEKHLAWGDASGARSTLVKRNCEIRKRFKEGESVMHLSDIYFLSQYTIKKIVYSKK